MLNRMPLAVLFCSLSVFGSLTAEADDSYKVLFLGNSMYFVSGGSVTPFKGFCSAAGIECEAASQFEYFGPPLLGRISPFIDNQFHDERILSLIKSGGFDYVVLKTRPTDFLDETTAQVTVEAFKEMHRLIVTSGAQTVIYMQHMMEIGRVGLGLSERVDADAAFETMPQIVEGHRKVRAELEAMRINDEQHSILLVPVGLLRIDGTEEFGVDAWWADRFHGTELAEYATGCMLYAYITKNDPRTNTFGDNATQEQAEWIKNRVWWYRTNFQ